jgi:hypothetical protein
MKKLTQDVFIQRAKEKHGDKYDYSKVDYKNKDSKVTIICPIHGEFEQIANSHMRGIGCVKCSHERKYSNTEDFILKAKAIWGETFSYEKVDYLSSKDKIIVTCKTHGDWITTPNRILSGHGCPKCKAINHRKKVCGVGIVLTDDFVSNEDSYRVWYDMICRCYNKKDKAYRDCNVCDEWLIYDNFRAWYDDRKFDGCALDKDWIKMWNRTYSPATCCLIPMELNSLIINRKGANNGLPIGVAFDNKNKKFYPKFRFRNTCNINVHGYKSADEAFLVYKNAKELRIKEVAEKYKTVLDPNVYNALINYEVESFNY